MFRNAVEELTQVLGELCSRHSEEDIQRVVEVVASAVRNGKKLLLVGNGGSAAEAQHMAAEYAATLSSKNFREGIPAIALTTDTSFLTAWSNDFGLMEIFSRQVETIGESGDVLFAYSTSGNSDNIIRAATTAIEREITVVGFSGNGGGRLSEIADLSLVVPSDNTARIQECHTLLGHTICGSVESALGFEF